MFFHVNKLEKHAVMQKAHNNSDRLKMEKELPKHTALVPQNESKPWEDFKGCEYACVFVHAHVWIFIYNSFTLRLLCYVDYLALLDTEIDKVSGIRWTDWQTQTQRLVIQ